MVGMSLILPDCFDWGYDVEEDQTVQNDGLMIVSEEVADGDLYWKISRGLQDECCAAESECPCLAYSVDSLYSIDID